VFAGIVQDGSIKPVSETPSVIAERLEESEIQVMLHVSSILVVVIVHSSAFEMMVSVTDMVNPLKGIGVKIVTF